MCIPVNQNAHFCFFINNPITRTITNTPKNEPYRILFHHKFRDEIKNNTTKVSDFYVDEALKLIIESGKLAADKDFISLYTTNDEMTSQMLELGAADYSKPSAIYHLSADKEQIMANIKALVGEEVAGGA